LVSFVLGLVLEVEVARPRDF